MLRKWVDHCWEDCSVLPFTCSADCPLCLNASRLNVWVWEFSLPLPFPSPSPSLPLPLPFPFPSLGVLYTFALHSPEVVIGSLSLIGTESLSSRKHSNASIWQCSIIVFEEIVVVGWTYLSLLAVLITYLSLWISQQRTSCCKLLL